MSCLITSHLMKIRTKSKMRWTIDDFPLLWLWLLILDCFQNQNLKIFQNVLFDNCCTGNDRMLLKMASGLSQYLEKIEMLDTHNVKTTFSRVKVLEGVFNNDSQNIVKTLTNLLWAVAQAWRWAARPNATRSRTRTWARARATASRQRGEHRSRGNGTSSLWW